jgi:muramidase (phage lysozyme)
MSKYSDALTSVNVRAFLRVIRHGESMQDESAYRWLFGSTVSKPKLFDSFEKHPQVRTYETHDGQFVRNGKIDFTTAAGAYQITYTTWQDCAKALGLQDFSPASQDLAAVFLIDRRGALDDVLAGRIVAAINKLGQEWASLPSAQYGQPTVNMDVALKIYALYGGKNVSEPSVLTPVPSPAPPPAWGELGDQPAVPPATQQESSMPIPVPFLMGLAQSLISIFAPLAQEKITKEINRHTDKPEVGEQIAAAIVKNAQVLTSKPDPIAAVAAARENPAVVEKLQAAALADIDKLIPVLDKLTELEGASWRAEEESRRNADERASLQRDDQDEFLTKSIVGLLIGLLVALMVLIGVMQWLKADAATVGTLIGLFAAAGGAVTAKFGTRYDHRYGSSRGSAAKDVLNAELTRRQPK